MKINKLKYTSNISFECVNKLILNNVSYIIKDKIIKIRQLSDAKIFLNDEFKQAALAVEKNNLWKYRNMQNRVLYQ